jgi:Zn-finger nucleic acid-binding protein
VLEGEQVDVQDLVVHAPNLVAVETPGSLVTVGRVTTEAGIHRPTVPVSMPHCPICGVELQLGSSGTLDHWSCPAGHGLAMTLSESYERLQEDEIAQMWQKARAAGPGPLPSPFTGVAMARVEIEADADEVPEGEPGDGPGTGTVVVDVDVENEFIWFDAGELDELPVDLPDAPPTPEQLAAEAEITARFGAGIEAAADERESRELSERLYRRVANHPGALQALDSVGRAVTAY